ncbi:hypothetical protein HK097_001264 [Rhizophlyctis rosea]|uniref:E3 ubiquitin-protein ligase CHFR n=1 Tax=Rhizophlyctis rosea TaxID=64517 RepID=A0AAD5S6T6_9FUNG|nr:hypothetical protein HK097_001264 [Rhizophlyctis rosea]
MSITPKLATAATVIEDDPSTDPGPSSEDTLAVWGRLESSTPETKHDITLSKAEITFGRGADLHEDTRIEDQRISTIHCKIYHDGGAHILDLSRNGTYVNGEKIGKNKNRQLHDSDVITFHQRNEDLPSYTFRGTTDKVASSSTPAAKRTISEVKRSLSEVDDETPRTKKRKVALADMESNVSCGICHDVLYKAVSVVPCLHTFCGGCYSDWLRRSNQCPQCRVRATSASRNHIVNNLVESFLTLNPEKRREAEELAELDRKDRFNNGATPAIPNDDAYGGDINDDDDDFDDEDDMSNLDDDDEDEDDEDALDANVAVAGYIHAFGAAPAYRPPPMPRCEQCPPGAAADGFSCPDGAAHVMCSGCMRLMPNRAQDPTVTQQCEYCQRFYCKLYYPAGLCGAGNIRNFAKLNDHRFDTIPNTSFGRNFFEQEILREYLRNAAVDVQSVWEEGLRKVEDGEYVLSLDRRLQVRSRRVVRPAAQEEEGGEELEGGGGSSSTAGGVGSEVGGDGADRDEGSSGGDGNEVAAGDDVPAAGPANPAPAPAAPAPGTLDADAFDGNVSKDDAACYGCAMHIFDELCYLYRQNLAVDSLPARAKNRNDCWWGRNCRTQLHNPQHAQRLNHVCEQTRRPA